jgi:hypothetical protein
LKRKYCPNNIFTSNKVKWLINYLVCQSQSFLSFGFFIRIVCCSFVRFHLFPCSLNFLSKSIAYTCLSNQIENEPRTHMNDSTQRTQSEKEGWFLLWPHTEMNCVLFYLSGLFAQPPSPISFRLTLRARSTNFSVIVNIHKKTRNLLNKSQDIREWVIHESRRTFTSKSSRLISICCLSSTTPHFDRFDVKYWFGYKFPEKG